MPISAMLTARQAKFPSSSGLVSLRARLWSAKTAGDYTSDQHAIPYDSSESNCQRRKPRSVQQLYIAPRRCPLCREGDEIIEKQSFSGWRQDKKTHSTGKLAGRRRMVGNKCCTLPKFSAQCAMFPSTRVATIVATIKHTMAWQV
eukprot:scaffold107464_cov28-Prasinocladus_malaysianus.AAC.1